MTTAQLTVDSRENILVDSQHMETLEKLQYLEDSSKYSRRTEETVVTVRPKFLGPLKGTNRIREVSVNNYNIIADICKITNNLCNNNISFILYK